AAILAGADDVVVLWGERAAQGDRGSHAIDALLALAGALGVADKPESGLIEIPTAANGRGLREVGVAPDMTAGLADAPERGHGTAGIGRALADGELTTLLLADCDPLTELSDRPTWERALERADAVVAFAQFVTPGLAEHATVVFPGESGAEQEGTLTHPDGRLQRIRQAVPHAGEVRPTALVLAELCARAGVALGAGNGAGPGVSLPDLSAAVFAAVPFYAGLTLDEIGGRGVRWQDRDAAAALPGAELPDVPIGEPPALADGLRLGAVPALFAAPAAVHSPSLAFLVPRQRAELSPADAERLGIAPGAPVEVSAGERTVRATAAIRDAIRPGSVFLLQGLGSDGAEALTNGVPRTVEVREAPPQLVQVGGGPDEAAATAGDKAATEAVEGGATSSAAAGSDAPSDPDAVTPDPGEAAAERGHPSEADES
ncbi:MAG: molybdopterin-dependent oxidoreductase, partial [Solirubrobacterales bacterium]|nr:molybdopterin-dependent oxidoreductase [Solirubrobacterales bacterium]